MIWWAVVATVVAIGALWLLYAVDREHSVLTVQVDCQRRQIGALEAAEVMWKREIASWHQKCERLKYCETDARRELCMARGQSVPERVAELLRRERQMQSIMDVIAGRDVAGEVRRLIVKPSCTMENLRAAVEVSDGC